MAKTYTDELAEWVRNRASKGRGTNFVTFLGVRDDVKAAIDAGYSAKTIWSNMHECGRVGFAYGTFMHYVNRLIKKGRGPEPGLHTGESIVAARTRAPAMEPLHATEIPSRSSAAPAQRTGMPTFKFNPIPSNREESK